MSTLKRFNLKLNRPSDVNSNKLLEDQQKKTSSVKSKPDIAKKVIKEKPKPKKQEIVEESSDDTTSIEAVDDSENVQSDDSDSSNDGSSITETSSEESEHEKKKSKKTKTTKIDLSSAIPLNKARKALVKLNSDNQDFFYLTRLTENTPTYVKYGVFECGSDKKIKANLKTDFQKITDNIGYELLYTMIHTYSLTFIDIKMSQEVENSKKILDAFCKSCKMTNNFEFGLNYTETNLFMSDSSKDINYAKINGKNRITKINGNTISADKVLGVIEYFSGGLEKIFPELEVMTTSIRLNNSDFNRTAPALTKGYILAFYSINIGLKFNYQFIANKGNAVTKGKDYNGLFLFDNRSDKKMIKDNDNYIKFNTATVKSNKKNENIYLICSVLRVREN